MIPIPTVLLWMWKFLSRINIKGLKTKTCNQPWFDLNELLQLTGDADQAIKQPKHLATVISMASAI